MKTKYETLDEFLEDVHNTLSIKDAIIQMGILEPKDFNGDFANCIFHKKDNSPSLQVTENFFKCYGCGVKGDLFSFLQLFYNIEFMEAIKKLADFYNVNIENLKVTFDKKTDKLKEEWERYLEQMDKAPKEIQEIKRDFFPQEIGYDSNINFVVLALTSKTGGILGFTKRRIDFMNQTDESGNFKAPKWKHSSLKDSLIGQCHNVFNYFIANREIVKTKEVILTEGPKDVIGYQRIGKNNTICACGTQNTTNIWGMVFPVERIVLSFDSDAAGLAASLKTILYLAQIFDLRNIEIVVLPEGEDPYSVTNLLYHYTNRVSAVSFFIENSTKEDVKILLDSVPEYNKAYVIKEICFQKEFSISETESWLNHAQIKNNGERTEKDKLLDFIAGKDGAQFMDIDRARKVLKLKYGITVD